jgi:hypothetical protein
MLFDDLNRGLLGPPDDSNIIILNDSDEEEEDTTNAEVAPSSATNSPTPTVFVADADYAPDRVPDDSNDGHAPNRVHDDSSDDGNEAGEPYAATSKGVCVGGVRRRV